MNGKHTHGANGFTTRIIIRTGMRVSDKELVDEEYLEKICNDDGVRYENILLKNP